MSEPYAALLRLIEALSYNHYRACLVGNPTPRVYRIYDRMRSPQVGDLVLEITSLGWADRDGVRLGRLLRIAYEPIYTPEQWQNAGGRPDETIPVERVWYIELPDGREYRWVNADFIVVPTGITWGAVDDIASDPHMLTALRSLAAGPDVEDNDDA